MSTTVYHRGSLTLDQLRRECEAYNIDFGRKLKKLQAAETETFYENTNKFNQGVYDDVPPGSDSQELLFREIKEPEDIVQAESDAIAGGYLDKLFRKKLFISNALMEVMGFGKN